MRTISVIAVTHNSAHLMREFCDSICNGLGPGDEFFVVDSGSSDLDELRKALVRSEVRLISSPSNIGYGAGNNLGAQRARGAWIAVVNPDVEVSLSQLHRLVEQAEKAGVDCIGPTLMTTNGRPIDNRRPLPRPPWRRDPPLSATSSEVVRTESMSGACMLIRRDVYHSLGGFDEYFFMFCEEYDLHKRLAEAGGALGVSSSVVVVTDGGGSSATATSRWAQTERDAAHVRYMWKHHGPFAAASDFILRSTHIVSRSAYLPRMTSVRQFLGSTWRRHRPTTGGMDGTAART
jgi:GT2 family glycosyltransferase